MLLGELGDYVRTGTVAVLGSGQCVVPSRKGSGSCSFKHKKYSAINVSVINRPAWAARFLSKRILLSRQFAK